MFKSSGATELTIGELSDRSGVAPSALRFYESEGLIAADRTERQPAPLRARRAAARRTDPGRPRQPGIPLARIRDGARDAARRAAPRRAATGSGCRAAGATTSSAGSRRSRRCATGSRRASAAAASRSTGARCSTRATRRPPRDRARTTYTATQMPEGDTLHRAARRLQALVGQRIEASRRIRARRPTRVAERIDGRMLESVEAIGKNLAAPLRGRRRRCARTCG